MSETEQVEPEAEIASTLSEEQQKQLDDEGWYEENGTHVVPLSGPLKSGAGIIEEMRLTEPNGFDFEKLGDPYIILGATGKPESDDEERDAKFEINRKKLNRYTELCNSPQLGFGEARNLCMQDSKNVHNAMQAFF